MMILKEFKIELNSKYTQAEKDILSEPERKIHTMGLCMRDAIKEYKNGNYRKAFLEMICVDSWANQVKEIFKKLSEEEE